MIAQVGVIPEERWRSLRIGDREIRQQYGGKRLEIGFASTVDEEQARADREQIDKMSKLLERLAPWPRNRRRGQRSKREREALRALGYAE